MMSKKIVRAFHYTRMMDDEVERLRPAGIMISVDFLRERVERRVEAADLSQEPANQVTCRTAHGNAEFGVRDGFWLTALPVHHDDGAVNMLLEHGGREGVAGKMASNHALSGAITYDKHFSP